MQEKRINSARLVWALVFVVLFPSGCAYEKPPSSTPTDAREPSDPYTDRTHLFYDEHHGNQIVYYDRKNRAYLWYPGNHIVITSTWRIDGNRICAISDLENTFNPFTGEGGRNWECNPIDDNLIRGRDSVRGDIFHLSSEQVPFILPAHPAFRSLADVK